MVFFFPDCWRTFCQNKASHKAPGKSESGLETTVRVVQDQKAAYHVSAARSTGPTWQIHAHLSKCENAHASTQARKYRQILSQSCAQARASQVTVLSSDYVSHRRVIDLDTTPCIFNLSSSRMHLITVACSACCINRLLHQPHTASTAYWGLPNWAPECKICTRSHFYAFAAPAVVSSGRV